MPRPLRISFVHPSLGIGGAERLVIDAACCLRDAGHRVTLFTPDLDPQRCFVEATNGSLDVRVAGSWLPPQIGGHLRMPCVTLRTAVAARAALMATPPADLFFCDLMSNVIPVLRLSRAPVLFYCHFPDQLTTPPRRGLYRLYRAPFDRLEEWTVGMAHRVLVNSRFCAETVRRTFPRLAHLKPQVLYPGVDCDVVNVPMPQEIDGPIWLVSINRFDPRKNLLLAVEAMAALRARLPAALFSRLRLVLVGAYDERLAEQRALMSRLQAAIAAAGLTNHVEIRASIDDAERALLVDRCRAVIYTPEGEHFGIVPLEAMARGRPVVAVASGGPLETVQDGRTGFLCAPTAAAFAGALARLVQDADLAMRLGEAARRHVVTNFSLRVFGARLEAIVREMARLHGTGT